MNEDAVAVFIPIVMFLVIGAVLLAFIYYRSRERESILAKDFSADELAKLFAPKKRKNHFISVGIIMVFFGLGLGLGLMLKDWYHREYYIPLFLFVSTGAGFITAGKINDKYHRDSVA